MTNIKIWGNATWFFLHTLAEKIKDDHFPKLKKDMFWILRTICSSLPCPDCRDHARKMLNSINFKNINTPNDFRIVLFTFHNRVNKRLKNPVMDIEELTQKYKKANTININNYFLRVFAQPTGNFKDMTNNMARKEICKYIQKWLIRNASSFNN